MSGLMQNVITTELNNINAYINAGNWHGAIFGIKDGYEILIKYVCLCVCSGMESEGDDSYCQKLLAPEKALSMGDWVNDVLTIAKKSAFAAKSPALLKFLKKLGAFYASANVVSWRNETLGHGLMNVVINQGMQDEIREKATKLADFLNTMPWPPELVPTEPFVLQTENSTLLFESLDRKGIVRYLDCTNRKRIIRNDVTFWKEKQSKYYDRLAVAATDTLANEVYLSDQDKFMDGFHLTKRYMKPEYMIHWMRNCLENYSGGVFLMQGARNTGKSSFVHACDELAGQGEQKIKLSDDTSVRAYYCSRINISNVNDFKAHLSDILRQSPDGQQIRSRGVQLPELNESNLYDILGFYRKLYADIYGTDKLVLFIDGIDELTVENMTVLEGLFPEGKTLDGAYIILTCRSEETEIQPRILDFTERFPFTDRVCFRPDEENEALLKKYLADYYGYEKEECEKVAKAMDDRFHVLPLLAYFTKAEIMTYLSEKEDQVWDISSVQAKTEEPARCNSQLGESCLQLEKMAGRYLQKLQIRYGQHIFEQYLDFLALIAEETEPLTIGEMSVLLGFGGISSRLLCFLKDATPFLQEYRSYRGNVYVMSQESMAEWVKREYPMHMQELALQWETELIGMEKGRTYTCREYELDGYLYMASNLSIIYSSRGMKGRREVLAPIQGLCFSVTPNHRMHRIVRAIHGMETIIATIEKDMMEEHFEDTYPEMLLLVAQRIIKLYYIIRRFDVCQYMMERIEKCLGKYPEIFRKNPVNQINLAVLYSNIMIYHGELNEANEAKKYYDLAMAQLETVEAREQELQDKVDELRNGLKHNLIGVFRNVDYGMVESLAEELYADATKSNRDYSAVNDLLMVAMAYKSAQQYQRSENVLREACDLLADLDASGTPRNMEIYANVYWRLCQSVNERYKWGEVSFTEIRIAIAIMDELIGGVIDSDLQGFAAMMHWKPDFMTTGALLRGTLAAILSGWAYRSAHFEKARDEALKAVAIIRQLYENMDKAGYQYNHINAMFNLMNCGCIYAEFGQYDEAIGLIHATLQKFPPTNGEEYKVWEVVKRKLEEIRSACIDANFSQILHSSSTNDKIK